jgi:ribosomal-protein-alanine N-acetyltransferase
VIGEALIADAATEDDLEALLTLERACYSHPWTERNFMAELSHPERGRVLTLRDPRRSFEADRGICSYLAFQVVEQEVHILNLAVAPTERRRGLARFMLELVLDLAGRRGASEALLEVRASNEAALRLYRSLGFDQLMRRRDYYRQPREDAIVLRKANLRSGPAGAAADP